MVDDVRVHATNLPLEERGMRPAGPALVIETESIQEAHRLFPAVHTVAHDLWARHVRDGEAA